MIHHVGVVVDRARAAPILALLRELTPVVPFDSRRIEVWQCECELYRVGTGTALFELVYPYGGKLAEWLAERGPTLHHVAVQVPDVRAVSRRLVEAGVPLVAPEPVQGVGNMLVNFVHPRHVGIMVELVELVPVGASGTI